MPVYNTPLKQLDLAIRSVLGQHYENWELCICDDASPNWDVRARLQNWQKQEPRINVTYSRKHGGISEASNQALSKATGEFIGLLDHDDELSPDALFEGLIGSFANSSMLAGVRDIVCDRLGTESCGHPMLSCITTNPCRALAPTAATPISSRTAGTRF